MISGQTRLLGLLGWPVAHSLSPAMHNAAAAAAGLDVAYVPLPVAPGAVAAAVRGLAALGFVGANVTVPHKQAVMAHLDEIDAAARAIGAVNTIKVSGETGQPSPRSLQGHNTDAAGFMADLEGLGVAVAGRDCLLLGAGGAARAVAYALARAQGRVHIFARRPAQAEKLVADLSRHRQKAQMVAYPWEALAQTQLSFSAPLVVNGTPLGMHGQENISPWPQSTPFPAGAFVYDLIYNPRETALLRQARAAGCGVANGLGMLLRQGALAFKIWTGVRPDIAVMERAVNSASASGP